MGKRISRSDLISEHEYSFRGKLWKDKTTGSWHFVSLPKTLSKKIRKIHGGSEEGWGRLTAAAAIGEVHWDTAVWFDTKNDTYLLPVKAVIRKKLGLKEGSSCKVQLSIEHG